MNKLASFMVFGIQGRYFLPLSVFLFAPLLAIRNTDRLKSFSEKLQRNLFKLFVGVQLFIWIYTIAHLGYIFYVNSSYNHEIGNFHHSLKAEESK